MGKLFIVIAVIAGPKLDEPCALSLCTSWQQVRLAAGKNGRIHFVIANCDRIQPSFQALLLSGTHN